MAKSLKMTRRPSLSDGNPDAGDVYGEKIIDRRTTARSNNWNDGGRQYNDEVQLRAGEIMARISPR